MVLNSFLWKESSDHFMNDAKHTCWQTEQSRYTPCALTHTGQKYGNCTCATMYMCLSQFGIKFTSPVYQFFVRWLLSLTPNIVHFLDCVFGFNAQLVVQRYRSMILQAWYEISNSYSSKSVILIINMIVHLLLFSIGMKNWKEMLNKSDC